MAKRRTRKQKIKTRRKLQVIKAITIETEKLTSSKFSKNKPGSNKITNKKLKSKKLSGSNLIIKDLIKTVVIFFILLGVLAAAYFRLR